MKIDIDSRGFGVTHNVGDCFLNNTKKCRLYLCV